MRSLTLQEFNHYFEQVQVLQGNMVVFVPCIFTDKIEYDDKYPFLLCCQAQIQEMC